MKLIFQKKSTVYITCPFWAGTTWQYMTPRENFHQYLFSIVKTAIKITNEFMINSFLRFYMDGGRSVGRYGDLPIDTIWEFSGKIYHWWDDMRNFRKNLSWTRRYENFQERFIIDETIWEFLGKIYHWWYDMRILPKNISQMIRYENCCGYIIINDMIW